MQENNFDAIINTWRRMSGEQTESVTVSMSGDSSDLHKKKDEESTLLVPVRLKGAIAIAPSPGTEAAIAEVPSETDDLEEKLLKRDNEESNVYQKEAAGDDNDKDNGYLENKEEFTSKPEEKTNKSADKVDSVFVSQTPIKVPPRSTASTPEEEDCGIKCLYYTLQCCDCVLM